MTDVDIVEYVEKGFGVKLFEAQKDILRECVKRRPVYLLIPAHQGWTNFKHLSLLAKIIFDKGENNEYGIYSVNN